MTAIPGGAQMNGIAAVSGNDIWAVGYLDNGTERQLWSHWDGTSWFGAGPRFPHNTSTASISYSGYQPPQTAPSGPWGATATPTMGHWFRNTYPKNQPDSLPFTTRRRYLLARPAPVAVVMAAPR